MEKNTVLKIENLSVQYVTEGVVSKAVSNVDIELKEGETLGLVGETGAGKTSTALAIMRLIPNPPGIVKSETVSINGRDIYKASQKELSEIRGSEVSMIFQDPMTVLNPIHTVGNQLAESIMIHEKLGRKDAMKRAGEMLQMVGIDPERINDYPHQFSGGMKQRVVIAIALSCTPHLLIADEPTTALDVTIQAQVLDMMKQLKEKLNTAMIMITHDLGIIADICDNVAVMYAGRIIEQGTLEDVFDHTRHPYTEGLFNSLPNIKKRADRLKPIKGLMPDPTALPEGCAFAPRCEYVCEKCWHTYPKMIEISPTHKCACIRYEEEGFHIEREDYHE